MSSVKNKIYEICSSIDKITVFVTISVTIIFSYYINPLDNVELNSWNRTFCSAVFSEISINRRIGEFYKLFLLYIPGMFILFGLFFYFLFSYRNNYKEYFEKISIFMIFTAFASYISRYSSDSVEILKNPAMQCIIVFYIVMSMVAILDFEERFCFEDIVQLFLTYIISIFCLNMCFEIEKLLYNIAISALLVLFYSMFVLHTYLGKGLYQKSKVFLNLFMWVPTFLRGALEGLFFLVEKGHSIQRYYTHIVRVTVLLILLALIISICLYKKNMKCTVLGYLGAIISLVTVSSFSANYQYIWSYRNFGNVYELGNSAVAMDSILYGKLPIIDYFSAHALGDVWTKILYGVIHKDVNAVFVNPYGGLVSILAYALLFFLVKNLFDAHIA